MAPAVAEAVLAVAPPGKVDLTNGRRVVSAWAAAKGWTRDAWGNHIVEAGKERWHFSKQRVHRQARNDEGEWSDIRSFSIIATAITLLSRAAEALGRTDVAAKATALRASRTSTRKKRASKAEEGRLRERAAVFAAKHLAHESPREVLLARQNKLESADAVNALRGRLAALQAEYLEKVKAGARLPGDEAFASLAEPPTLPLVSAIDYEWVETVGGIRYTIALEAQGGGAMAVHIGSEGHLRIDPVSHAVKSSTGQEGDGAVAGVVSLERGKLAARLFSMGATSPGAGLRLGWLWCQLLRGWKIREWLAEAVGVQGEAFIQAAAKRGSLSVVGRKGSYLVVRCEKR
jgi:hypothetical protein